MSRSLPGPRPDWHFGFADAVRVGEFDGATVELDRLFGAGGAIVWFYGRVADTDSAAPISTMKGQVAD